MSTNKELALTWFEALVTGDAETAMSLISDDFRYFLTGTLPASGWWDKEGFFASDFTLAEIRTLRAVQPLGERDPRFNGRGINSPSKDATLGLTSVSTARIAL